MTTNDDGKRATQGGGEGSIIGSGVSRYYVTKEGDTLEAIAAYFYGDPKHKQRLLDDNPSLLLEGDTLPAGKQIAVSDDAARGDTVSQPEV
jgi:phage tail protein X